MDVDISVQGIIFLFETPVKHSPLIGPVARKAEYYENTSEINKTTSEVWDDEGYTKQNTWLKSVF